MAVILTVHGTFASGPQEGENWWQRGSPCVREVETLVESEDGRLKIEPFVWDGLNSERSRQNAGAELLERMQALEKAGERYFIVAHSHGGTVTAAALVRAADKRQTLEHLSRWITVGTPFIQAKRSRLLFSRLGPGGKTVFLSILSLLVASVFLGAGPWSDILYGLVGVSTLLLMIGYPIIWLLARNRLFWHKPQAQSAARQAFSGKWFVLRHKDDEAVQGLGAFATVRHPIFPRDFAVDCLSRLAVLIVPIAICLLLAASFAYSNKPGRIESSKGAVELTAPQQKQAIQKHRATTLAAAVEDDSGPPLAVVLGIIVGIIVIAGPPALLYFLVQVVARPTSALLSRVLNHMAWSQLQRTSLGGDIDGESLLHAANHPPWLKAHVPTQPKDLGDDITRASDEAAARSISKFRAALNDLGLYNLEQGGKDTLNAFLSGKRAGTHYLFQRGSL